MATRTIQTILREKNALRNGGLPKHVLEHELKKLTDEMEALYAAETSQRQLPLESGGDKAPPAKK